MFFFEPTPELRREGKNAFCFLFSISKINDVIHIVCLKRRHENTFGASFRHDRPIFGFCLCFCLLFLSKQYSENRSRCRLLILFTSLTGLISCHLSCCKATRKRNDTIENVKRKKRNNDEAKRNYDIWPQRTMFMHDEVSKKEISFFFFFQFFLLFLFVEILMHWASMDETMPKMYASSWVHKGKMWNVKVQFRIRFKLSIVWFWSVCVSTSKKMPTKVRENEETTAHRIERTKERKWETKLKMRGIGSEKWRASNCENCNRSSFEFDLMPMKCCFWLAFPLITTERNGA